MAMRPPPGAFGASFAFRISSRNACSNKTVNLPNSETDYAVLMPSKREVGKAQRLGSSDSIEWGLLYSFRPDQGNELFGAGRDKVRYYAGITINWAGVGGENRRIRDG
jgi:hypothetical protein